MRVLSGGRARPGLREVWPEVLILAALISLTLLVVWASTGTTRRGEPDDLDAVRARPVRRPRQGLGTRSR
jgi:hypothetical protein